MLLSFRRWLVSLGCFPPFGSLRYAAIDPFSSRVHPLNWCRVPDVVPCVLYLFYFCFMVYLNGLGKFLVCW